MLWFSLTTRRAQPTRLPTTHPDRIGRFRFADLTCRSGPAKRDQEPRGLRPIWAGAGPPFAPLFSTVPHFPPPSTRITPMFPGSLTLFPQVTPDPCGVGRRGVASVGAPATRPSDHFGGHYRALPVPPRVAFEVAVEGSGEFRSSTHRKRDRRTPASTPQRRLTHCLGTLTSTGRQRGQDSGTGRGSMNLACERPAPITHQRGGCGRPEKHLEVV